MGLFPFRMFHNGNSQFFTRDKDLTGNEPETEDKKLELLKGEAANPARHTMITIATHTHKALEQKEQRRLHPRLCWKQASLVCVWSCARLPFPSFKMPEASRSKPVTAAAKETVSLKAEVPLQHFLELVLRQSSEMKPGVTVSSFSLAVHPKFPPNLASHTKP